MAAPQRQPACALPPASAEGRLRMKTTLRLALLALAVAGLLAVASGRASAATTSTSRSGASLTLGVKAVEFARRLLGVPYRYGGSSPRTGFDCSGFVRFVYDHFGLALPHSSYAQFGLGRRVPRRSLKPGDLVFFDGLGHVGLYVGAGRFVHAPSSGKYVRTDELRSAYWKRHLSGTRRF